MCKGTRFTVFCQLFEPLYSPMYQRFGWLKKKALPAQLETIQRRAEGHPYCKPVGVREIKSLPVQ